MSIPLRYGLGLFLLTAVFVLARDAQACAILSLHRDGQVLMGNNEDYIKPGAIWFSRGSRRAYGRVNVGFYDKFAQGGMNEKGLAFDAATLQEVPWSADPKKETPRNLIEKIMDECATVEEALAYFERYNCTHLANAQFYFADAKGDAAVVAWLPDRGLSISRPEGEYLIATNTRLEASGYRCQRHVRVSQVLEERKGPGLEAIAAALEAIHQHGPHAFTSYSTIYDLKARKVHVYNLADFSAVKVFDLAEELARQRHSYTKLSDLFPDGPKLESIMNQEQRSHWDTRVALDDEVLRRYEGRYSVQADIEAEILRDGKGGLILRAEGQNEAHLVPEGTGRFRLAPDRGTLTFHGNEAGVVEYAILHRQTDVPMKRLGDLE